MGPPPPPVRQISLIVMANGSNVCCFQTYPEVNPCESQCTDVDVVTGKCKCNSTNDATAIGSLTKCQAICEPNCINGFCVEPNRCNCNDGYRRAANESEWNVCHPICNAADNCTAECMAAAMCRTNESSQSNTTTFPEDWSTTDASAESYRMHRVGSKTGNEMPSISPR